MPDSITPLPKQSLADNLAQEVKNFIVRQGYLPGEKLPTTSELAQRFGVGLPTLREGLKKLETIGAIKIKHGSGVYVGDHINSIFLMNPIITTDTPTQKELLDLIDARIAIEPNTAALAAAHATPEQIAVMAELLQQAKENFANENILSQKNMQFHKSIAEASGNAVFAQILTVITRLFAHEQRVIIDIFRSKETDHRQHVEIFEAIREKERERARALMHAHLAGVRDAILRWNPGV